MNHPSLEKPTVKEEHKAEESLKLAEQRISKLVEKFESAKGFPMAIMDVQEFHDATKNFAEKLLEYLKTEKILNVQQIRQIIEQTDNHMLRILAVLEKIGQNADKESEVLDKLNKVLK